MLLRFVFVLLFFWISTSQGEVPKCVWNNQEGIPCVIIRSSTPNSNIISNKISSTTIITKEQIEKYKKLYFEKSNKVRLILVGSITLILLQALIHIGVNIRLLPTTGMTLPFLSYGGSSIVSTAILCGIILNLTKRKIN